MICSIDFSRFGDNSEDNVVYTDFKNSVENDKYNKEIVIFDDSNCVAWMVWYAKDKIVA